MHISDEAKRLLAMIVEVNSDDDAPRLSDLVELWLKENVNDASIVTLQKANWDGYYKGVRDFDSYDVKLNRLIIAKVFNTYAVVELRWWNRLGTHDEVNNDQVLAADPLLFEKFWAHIAEVDAKLGCPGFSLIDKPVVPYGVEHNKPVFVPYPAFENDAN